MLSLNGLFIALTNDVAGLASYSTLRPLVYRESSVVLICYSSHGHGSIDKWVSEVRDPFNFNSLPGGIKWGKE